MRAHAIRTEQLDDALAMRPDLMTVFAGVNDVIGPVCDFDLLRAELVIMFGEARRAGATVATFTMPDPTAINPLAARLRDRVTRLNAIIRSEAESFGVLLVDFAAYPVAADPRLWYVDRLHGNTLGHIRVKVVQQHPQGSFLQPAFATYLCAGWCFVFRNVVAVLCKHTNVIGGC